MSKAPNPQEPAVGFYKYSEKRGQEFDDKLNRNYDKNWQGINDQWKIFARDANPFQYTTIKKDYKKISETKGVGWKLFFGVLDTAKNIGLLVGGTTAALMKTAVNTPAIIGNSLATGITTIGTMVDTVSKFAGSGVNSLGDLADKVVKNLADERSNSKNMFVKFLYAVPEGITSVVSGGLHILGNTANKMGDLLHNACGLAGSVAKLPFSALSSVVTLGSRTPGYLIPNLEDTGNKLVSTLKSAVEMPLTVISSSINTIARKEMTTSIAKATKEHYQITPVQQPANFTLSTSVKTFAQAQQVFQQQMNSNQLKPFEVASNNLKDGNGTITYVKPGDRNDKDHQVTYKYENGKLTDITAGKSVSCVLPPIQKENGKGFEWNHVVNGQKTPMSVNHAQQHAQPEIIRPNTPNVTQGRNPSQVVNRV